jgi:tripartite-type tricarboxylate transporter receptor subunit TctC
MFELLRLPTLRRTTTALLTVAGVLTALAGVSTAHAAFPDKPVTLVVPYPAGGTPDILARVLSEHLSKRFGQTLVVENRVGASGNIGAQAVARADATGYTLLMCAFGCAVAPSLYKPAPYDVVKDFSPVAMVGTVPSVLVVNPSVPARNVAELLAYAKKNPGKLNSASSGVGTSAHLATELLNTKAGIQLTHIPYKGAGQVAADLLGGQVDMYFDNLPASLASIRAGKLRALAVASERRSPSIPDVPTFAEAGVADFLITPWFGVMAPAGTPKAVIQTLNEAFVAALNTPAVRDRMQQLGVDVAAGTPEALGTFIAGEDKKWKTIIQANGIRVE